MTRAKVHAPDGREGMIVFVEQYCRNGGNATRACINAGYSEASAGKLGSRLLSTPKIQEAIRAYNMRLLGGELSVKALQVLNDIMVDVNAPAGARVDCAKTILDRAGYRIGGEAASNTKPINEMSHEELMAVINNYPNVIKQLSDKAQAVDAEIVDSEVSPD